MYVAATLLINALICVNVYQVNQTSNKRTTGLRGLDNNKGSMTAKLESINERKRLKTLILILNIYVCVSFRNCDRFHELLYSTYIFFI